MTDKCHNKKLFYYKNPSAIKSMPDDVLIKAYQLAKQKDLNEDFILFFESKLRDRGIID